MMPELFIRGTFNDWQALDSWRLIKDNLGVWNLKVEVPAGVHSFKIGDAHWSQDCNYGAAPEVNELGINGSLQLHDQGQNILLHCESATELKFEFQSETGQLALSRVVPPTEAKKSAKTPPPRQPTEPKRPQASQQSAATASQSGVLGVMEDLVGRLFAMILDKILDQFEKKP